MQTSTTEQNVKTLLINVQFRDVCETSKFWTGLGAGMVIHARRYKHNAEVAGFGAVGWS